MSARGDAQSVSQRAAAASVGAEATRPGVAAYEAGDDEAKDRTHRAVREARIL